MAHRHGMTIKQLRKFCSHKAGTMNDSPIIVDIEASGFGRGSYPIEVGVALSDGRLLARLISPAKHWTHWQKSAERVHGISRAKLEKRGCEVREVAVELNALLANHTVYTDGWGVDRSWLALLFDEACVLQQFRLESVYTLLNEKQLEAWPDNRDKVIALTGMTPHRAGTDALLVQRTFLYTVYPKKFKEQMDLIKAA